MRILNVILFSEGGHRLFVRNYDRRIYSDFGVDHFLGFIEALSQALSKTITKEDIEMVLFNRIGFIFHHFHRNSKKYGVITFSVLIVSEIDRTIPLDPQEIVLRHLAEHIGATFFEFYKQELAEFFQSWHKVISAFQQFHPLLDEIVTTGSVIDDELIDDLINSLTKAKRLTQTCH